MIALLPLFRVVVDSFWFVGTDVLQLRTLGFQSPEVRGLAPSFLEDYLQHHSPESSSFQPRENDGEMVRDLRIYGIYACTFRKMRSDISVLGYLGNAMQSMLRAVTATSGLKRT
ncbi:hypothetical protein LWI28_014210 [Acer negundo]|uniref:Uncharacterized protein n=1 Tax=Acer negundo TaxID=4023 RepID=A0AAD5NXC4_ACENE|nr:hypothetical protein LWI28_014210 [Acer negundo]